MSKAKDNTLLEFPCDFPIKMMGRDRPGFREAAIALIEQHAGEISDDAIRTNLSREGNFLSITVTIKAKNQEQLHDIYRDLTANDEILVAL